MIPSISKPLPFGDFAIFLGKNTIGIERKTLSDLMHSYETDRLFQQLEGLRASYHYPWLLIEGHPTFTNHPDGKSTLRLGSRTTQWPFLTFYNGIIAKARHAGIPTINTGSLAETLRWIAGYYHYLSTHDLETDNVTAHVTRLNRKQDPRITALCAVPRLGPVVAQALLDHFGSIAASIIADDGELRRVNGVGPSTVVSFRSVFPHP